MYIPQASALVSGYVKIGADRSAVIAQLGTPQRKETYGNTEFFFYNVPWQLAIGAVGRLPIAIADGKVVGFGKSNYESYLKNVDRS